MMKIDILSRGIWIVVVLLLPCFGITPLVHAESNKESLARLSEFGLSVNVGSGIRAHLIETVDAVQLKLSFQVNEMLLREGSHFDIKVTKYICGIPNDVKE